MSINCYHNKKHNSIDLLIQLNKVIKIKENKQNVSIDNYMK